MKFICLLVTIGVTLVGLCDQIVSKTGAVMSFADARLDLSVCCSVKPGPRPASLTGDVVPPADSAVLDFHIGAARNGVDPDIDGRLAMDFGCADSVGFSYELLANKDQEVDDLYLSAALPVEGYAGGRIVVDGTNEVKIADAYANVGTPVHGVHSSLAFYDKLGNWRFTLRQTKPRWIVVQDTRAWKAKCLGVRLPLAAHRRVSKGERFSLGLSIQTPDPTKNPFERRIITKGKDWIPVVLDSTIIPGSVCDFSAQVPHDAPAGKHGWIVASGENFEFEGMPNVPQRFYGNNLGHDLPLSSRDGARRLAGELLKNGYNAVRLHYWDYVMTANTKDGTTIPDDRLLAFDGFMKEMIDAGIYVATDLFTTRAVPYRAIGIDRDGMVPMDDFKQLVLAYDPAVSNLEEYVGQLLTHVNPLTGHDYAHEPALAWYCLVNEGNAGDFGTKLMDEFDCFQDAWKQWLAARRQSDSRYANIPDEMPTSVYDESINGVAVRQFLCHLEERFDKRMKAFVRSLGSRALVSSMNAWFNPISYQIVRQDVYDYVDDHFYVDHPQWTPKTRFPTYCDGSIPIGDGRSGVPRVVSRRLLSKPFTVTEYNYSVPGKYRGMGGLLMGSFAALQNWSGVWRFCFGRDIGRLDHPNSYRMTFHDSWVDPMMRASEYVFSALFLRRDLEPLDKLMPIPVSRLQADSCEVEPVTMTGNLPWASLAWYARTGTVVSESQPSNALFRVTSTEAFKLDVETAKNRAFPRGIKGMSGTPHVWFNEKEGSFFVNTPRTCGISAEGGRHRAGFLAVEITGSPSTVWITSWDGKPLADSKRMLLAHLTDAEDEGTVFRGGNITLLEKWGTPPHLLKNGMARVVLAIPFGEGEVWAVSSGGRRMERLPLRNANGMTGFDADVARDPNSASWLYEIVLR